MRSVDCARGMDTSGVRCLATMVVVSAGLAYAAALALPVAAQDEGVKQVERLVKSSGSAVQSIVETKNQIAKTMDAYNAVLADDVKDRPAAYKALQKEMNTTERKRAEIAKRVGEMDAEADALFKGWSDSAARLENPDLRKRTEERLTKTKASYADIKATGKTAGDLYDPILKSLKEQVVYLGHDLNASSVGSLKPDAEKLNLKAKELFTAIDDTVAVANKNIGALRPR